MSSSDNSGDIDLETVLNDDANNNGNDSGNDNGDEATEQSKNKVAPIVSPIFKLYNLTGENTIDTVIVFYGYRQGRENMVELSDLFIKNPKDDAFKEEKTGTPIFSEKELMEIKSSTPAPKIVFVNASLRIDDSVERVKLKIMNAMSNQVSVEEMYLFCHKKEEYNPIFVHQMLSQDDKFLYTNKHINQFTTNIREYAYKNDVADLNKYKTYVQTVPQDKTKYNYNDIVGLDLNDKVFIVDKQIGQNLIFGDSEYPFIVNPYAVTNENKFSEKMLKIKINVLNSDLLLNTGYVENNSIYLSLAQNIFKQLPNRELDEYMFKIYYPMLFNAGLQDRDDLTEVIRQQMIAPSIAMTANKSLQVFEGIDMFYDVYNNSEEARHNQQGVKMIRLVMHPDFNTTLPLDIIFKLLHAEKATPLVKQSFDSKQENIYRIYTDKVAINGAKIPYLNISSINNLTKSVSKYSSVSVYVEYLIARSTHIIFCTFEENGSITIDAKFDDTHLTTLEELDDLLRKHVNPVLQIIKTNFAQSGISINLYDRVTHPNIEIQNMTYKFSFSNVNKFDIQSKIGCISSAFNIESNDFDKSNTATLRFKRVSNFNKLTSLEIFMTEKVNQEMHIPEILDAMVQNFNISEKEASNIWSGFISAQQVSVGLRRSTKKIKTNPGFQTTIEYKNKNVSVEVEGINDILYMNTIPVYIDTLIRILQPSIETRYPLQKIKRICSGASNEGVGDVVASVPVAEEDEEDEPLSEDEIEEIENIFHSQEEETDKNDGAVEEVPAAKDIVSEEVGSDVEEVSAIKETEDINPISKVPEVKTIEIPKTVKKPVIFGMDSEGEEEEDEDEEKEKVIEERVLPAPREEPVAARPQYATAPAELKTIVVPKKTEVKKIFGMDSEGEEDEEEDEEGTKGGAKGDKPIVLADVSSLKLKNDNPFPQDRIAARDPILFESMENSMNSKSKFKFSKTQNNYTAYSTMCASNIKRQPVVLTKEELLELKGNPGALSGTWKGDKYVGNDVLEYGADPNNKNYYICPQYWCLTTDKMLTHKQVLDGECGGVDKIIPKGASTPGKNTIYQFYDPSEHGPSDEKGNPKNYQQHYPSFLSKNKTNDGYCLPCCFKNFNTPSHIAIKQECLGQGNKADSKSEKSAGLMGQKEEISIPEAKSKKTDKGDYIKGPEKFPLEYSRWGYLPIAVQHFFEEANINTNCQVSASNTSLKKFTPCLLRRGVERSVTQSFIACLASASQRFNTKTPTQIETIREFKTRMLYALTIDGFMRYQNGNLISKFSKPIPNFNIMEEEYNDPRYPELFLDYKKSRLFKMMSRGNESQTKLLNRVAQSFLNFKAYINNDDVVIDYTYLWDFVCEKNINLFPDFPNGLNLVILNIVDNDVTNNVELICPTNQQSSAVFNTHKNSLMLICKGGVFEPIYLFEDREGAGDVIKTTFMSKNTFLTKPLRTLFDVLIKPMFDKCTPLPSISSFKYNVEDISIKHALNLSTLISRLKDLKYEVKHQVLNYQGKVIGVVAYSSKKGDKTEGNEGNDDRPGVAESDDEDEGEVKSDAGNIGKPATQDIPVLNKSSNIGFIPCYPSSIYDNGYKYGDKLAGNSSSINYIFMDDHDKIWNTYENTILFLQRFSNTVNVHQKNLKKMKIPCAPILRVVDNGVVIGLLTETNQFVQISDPFIKINSQNDTHGLKDIEENNYLIGDLYKKDGRPERDRKNVDEYTINNGDIDISRINYIKKIKLEENFYNVFRNSIRIFLNKPENIRVKQEITNFITNEGMLYNVKIEKVMELLNYLVSNKIQFYNFGKNTFSKINDMLLKDEKGHVEPDNKFEQEIRKIGECIISSNCETNTLSKFCKKQKDDSASSSETKCVLILPTTNLITNAPNNKERYFNKVADELIRYKRSRNIFLSPQTYFGNNISSYNLNKDEIILLESSLKEYFKTLPLPKSVQTNDVFDYDDANPSQSDYVYVNEDKTEDELLKELSEKNCEQTTSDKVESIVWSRCFVNAKGDKFGEIIFSENVQCTFQLVIYILNHKDVLNKALKKQYNDTDNIKTLLLEEYKRHILNYVVLQKQQKNPATQLEVRDNFILKITSILIEQSKKTRGDQVMSKDLNFASFIEYPDYYLTFLDLWVLFEHFKIPCIFLSKKCLFENGAKQLVAYSGAADNEVDVNERFLFIMSSSPAKGKVPQYKIITHNGSIMFSLSDFKDSVYKNGIIEAIQNKIKVLVFMGEFDLKDVKANKLACKK